MQIQAVTRRTWGGLRREERRSLAGMAGVVVGLHVIGFLVLFALVAPRHLHLGGGGTFTVGLGLTAYTLGLRHAVDADHIAAIDNTTRKLMADGKRPLSVGFFFSLGHASVVFALSLLFAVGFRALSSSVEHGGSALHSVTSVIGTGVSGGFLYIIAAVNLAILPGIARTFADLRSGRCDEAALAERMASGGAMNRVLGRFTRKVDRPGKMYPLGILFGLGFDTATEVALLFLAAGAAGARLPFYAILCLPILFAAGMSLLDTIDGSFMNFAYGWAFSQPVRKIYYNLTITGLSVAVALLVGTVELLGLLAQKLNLHGAFWDWVAGIDINTLGIVIVGMFVAAWALAMLVWRFGRIEQRFSAIPGSVSSRTAGVAEM